MLKLILLGLFLDSLVRVLFKIKPTTLNCGIFGWSGSDVKLFDPVRIHLLGLSNQTRGKDSSGIFFDNRRKVQLGDYHKFIHKREDFEIPLEKRAVLLGHCRKGSVGGINTTNAQPLMAVTKENNFQFSIIHNGTLGNYIGLASKYKVKTKGVSDSMVLGRLIYKVGWKVLSEYVGGAAFAYTSNEDPEAIFIFRGRSKSVKAGSVVTDERPLYILKEPGQIYFSSIKESLEDIKSGNGEILEPNPNVVIKIKNGEVVEEESVEIDRTKSFQREPYSYGNQSHCGYDDAWNNHGHSHVLTGKYKDEVFASISTHGDDVHINIKDKIYYYHGRYYMNGNLATIKSFFDDRGQLVTDSNTLRYEMAFVEGAMLENVSDFHTCFTQFTAAEGDEAKVNALLRFSEYPLEKPVKIKPNCGHLKTKNKMGAYGYYSGTFQPAFSTNEYIVKTGDVKARVKTDYLLYSEAFDIIEDVEEEEVVTETFDYDATRFYPLNGELCCVECHSTTDELNVPYCANCNPHGTTSDAIEAEDDSDELEDGIVANEVKYIVRGLHSDITAARTSMGMYQNAIATNVENKLMELEAEFAQIENEL